MVFRMNKTITPIQKLRNRIGMEFSKKKFIGDINLNDEEYNVLIESFKNKFSTMSSSVMQKVEDPMIAVALVQIGIRYYDGNYWGHVGRILGNKLNPSGNQQWLGEAFIHILKKHHKYVQDERERVNSILAHCFVSDHYAEGLFEFMFDYYRIDLERDLNRNTTEAMNGMIQAIKESAIATEMTSTIRDRTHSSVRVYKLRKHTVHAISAFPIISRIKLLRILRLMDKCFWDNIKPANPVSRLTIRFNEWHEDANSFKTDYSRFYGETTSGKGRKSYSSPYLWCDLRNTKFFIIIPSQLLKEVDSQQLSWVVHTSTRSFIIPGAATQAVTGYKTLKKEIELRTDELFDEISIELKSYTRNLRKFPKVVSDVIRFFDKDGDYSKIIFRGEMYGFTSGIETPLSAALIDNEPIRELVRSYFDFEEGDIVILPDGKSLVVGEKYLEGIMRRHLLEGVYTLESGSMLSIYNASPTVLLSIPDTKVKGTMIEINGIRHKMFDQRVTLFDTFDGSGNRGLLIQLEEWGCTNDGLYTVVIDVPNDRKTRFWKFVLINGLKSKFEDAPYLFEQRATIIFSETTSVKPLLSSGVQHVSGENAFNFEIIAETDEVGFELDTIDGSIAVYFQVPALKWKYNHHPWQVLAPPDLWHTHFPSRIYFKFPENKIALSMEESFSEKGPRLVVYEKTIATGMFECDLTRFRSWFDRNRTFQWIYITVGSNRIPLMRVFTKSEIVSHLIVANFERNSLVAELEIIGQSEYYADIIHIPSSTKIAHKLQIQNGKLECYAELKSGMYRLDVFEAEMDDTGFGESVYYQLKSLQQNLINPYDLTSKKLVIRNIKNPPDSAFSMSLQSEYIVSGLIKTGINSYEGMLSVQHSKVNKERAFKVSIEIPNLNRIKMAHLTFWDNEEKAWLDFMYDSKRKAIVNEEDNGLRISEKYRRYSMLYPEECVYLIDII